MDQLIGATDLYFVDVRRWFPRNTNNLGLFSDLASIRKRIVMKSSRPS